jgi:hypothetical protein
MPILKALPKFIRMLNGMTVDWRYSAKQSANIRSYIPGT